MGIEVQQGPWHDDGSESKLKVKAASEEGPTELVYDGSESNESTGFAEPQFSESPSDAPERTITNEDHVGKPTGLAKHSDSVVVAGDWPPAPKVMTEEELAAEQEKPAEKPVKGGVKVEAAKPATKARRPAQNKAAKPAANKGGR